MDIMENYKQALTDIKETIWVIKYIKHDQDDLPGAQDISDEELKSIMIGLKQINILKLHDFVSKKQNLI